jgi:cytochrome c oxidase subunit 2
MPSRMQSALHPAGTQADQIAWLWWLMFAVSAAVFVVVVAGLCWAVYRGRSASAVRPSQRQLTIGVGAALAISLITLYGLLFASVIVGRGIASLEHDKPLEIDVTGYQWWWHVKYPGEQPYLEATTANEIRLPLGRHARITLRSGDVIHSFWVPNLHGKVDMVPGRANEIWLRADRPGVYRAQCAEYCGMQHAHMALTVVVEDHEAFERWVAAQRLPAQPPQPADAQRGQRVFETGPCAMCHSIRGTIAGGRTAPDLTHIASRPTLGAGTLPNTPENMTAWINNPNNAKPGAKMPSIELREEDLRAVVAYLQTLR